ncbi:hypothetical protein DWQ65_07740 [Treponema phagedenis]|uniref:Uncharacterized protein n=1 Tax=Treponema phagedenis TaxID=162 RepID=A0A0B7GQJ2_TREPH|nr:hypothetical protein [Treponema phagedenis]EFW37555.1 hypothetical protein HMPREF9554_01947 [Treponema phagedenis F0421]NVP24844.1 hypothetical protein [Treponema phagedenis]QEJ95990.1 hypothetical protein FUT79_12800 [Treponema phagedenis]QEJ98951.1 hypothetical protein FUT82_13770 [Treponema phagedenis]QEK01753.1 hypothetical protein FUT84_11715 [Treponema phagedenis]
MALNIFITDNRLQFSRSLAEMLKNNGDTVCISSETHPNADRPLREIYWNRKSPFSLQSLHLELKNLNITIDAVIFIFDGPAYIDLYQKDDIAGIDTTVTDLISANMSLAYVFSKFFLKQNRGKFIFIHREIATGQSNAPLAAASGAFIRMAEEVVHSMIKEESPHLQTLLVKLEGTEDDSFIQWITTQLSLPVLTRSPGRWIRAGQRGFFGK